jgi:ribonuclease HI
MWIGLRTLPQTNPLARVNTEGSKRFRSPLQKIASTYRSEAIDRLEIIEPYMLTPWDPRLQANINTDKVSTSAIATRTNGLCIATSASIRNGVVGMGGVIRDTGWSMYNGECMPFSITLGPRIEQNLYIANLTAISEGLLRLVPPPRDRTIKILTSDQGALQAISKPKHQSGQATIKRIYKEVQTLRRLRNHIRLEWMPARQESDLGQIAKATAYEATEKNRAPNSSSVVAKSTMISIQKQSQARRTLHTKAG